MSKTNKSRFLSSKPFRQSIQKANNSIEQLNFIQNFGQRVQLINVAKTATFKQKSHKAQHDGQRYKSIRVGKSKINTVFNSLQSTHVNTKVGFSNTENLKQYNIQNSKNKKISDNQKNVYNNIQVLPKGIGFPIKQPIELDKQKQDKSNSKRYFKSNNNYKKYKNQLTKNKKFKKSKTMEDQLDQANYFSTIVQECKDNNGSHFSQQNNNLAKYSRKMQNPQEFVNISMEKNFYVNKNKQTNQQFSKNHTNTSLNSKINKKVSKFTPKVNDKVIERSNLNHSLNLNQTQIYGNTRKRVNSIQSIGSQLGPHHSSLLIQQKSSIDRRKKTAPLTSLQKQHQARMQSLISSFVEQKFYQRLRSYSQQTSKSSIRIYRQDLQKIITQRYGKDRITSFLDMEYIQDYQSLKKSTRQILKFTQQQVLVFTFLIFDQNRDGLITAEDLLNVIGAKSENKLVNQLIMADTYEIVNYVQKKSKKGERILDQFLLECDFLCDEKLTLMKYRILNYKKNRKLAEKNQYNKIKQNNFITRKLFDHLYILQEEQQLQRNLKRAKLSDNKVYRLIQTLISFELINPNPQAKSTESRNSPTIFALNFNSFRSIFQNSIPKIFLDFMFLYAGIQKEGLKYLDLDCSVLIPPAEKKEEQQQRSYLQVVKEKLQVMRGEGRVSLHVYRNIRR